MNGALRHPLRFTARASWLAVEFAWAAMLRLTVTRANGTAARAVWLQRHSARLLRVLNVQLDARGPLPCGGFLVANHLSYLDILALAASAPCVFVAKREVRGWPVFGWFARLAGTIFVDRNRRTDSSRTIAAMRSAATRGVLVVLFPEGTSSNGADVLPFKSSLLEPLTDQPECGIAHLSYGLDDGCAADEVCYWRDMTLVPHLANLLTKREVTARARFALIRTRGMDRKELAVELRRAIVRLSVGSAAETVNARDDRLVAEFSTVCHVPVARM